MPKRTALLAVMGLCWAGVIDTPSAAASSAAAPSASTPEPAPIVSADPRAIAGDLRIPYQQFQLNNGLTVIVHTDRRVPLVAVAVWYKVGARNEPDGRTGFAHLFEHLMFNGSANAPGDFFAPMEAIGATDVNGSTFYNFTNYYETVPTGALARTLFLESDRMGHLLGGVDQAKLDAQRGVVQNEKRQGDNRPFGLVDYVINHAVFPAGSPYRRSVIGSMADLNAATLADVRAWFRDHYGPNNAVLVLAGDVDPAQARTLAQAAFGALPPGPALVSSDPPVVPLAAPISRTITDRVPNVRLIRVWPLPGITHPDMAALQLGARVLGGLASSRLDDALVRGEGDALSAGAWVSSMGGASLFTISINVRPGVDPARVGARAEAELQRLMRKGPTDAEIRRVATSDMAGLITGMDALGGNAGRAAILADSWNDAGDPHFYARRMEAMADLTPAQTRTIMRRWLDRPALTLRVEPGPRHDDAAMKAITGDTESAVAAPVAVPPIGEPRREAPPIGSLATLRFPAIQRFRLANGIPVSFIQGGAIPQVQVQVSFDAGSASDPPDRPGLQALTLMTLREATRTRDSARLASDLEALGASIDLAQSAESSGLALTALSANLEPSLDLLAELVRAPALAEGDMRRMRAQLATRIAATRKSPAGLAGLEATRLIYGDDHPYARGSLATEAGISRLNLADVHQAQSQWLRPETARIFVVGPVDRVRIQSLLEARFGRWNGAGAPVGRKVLPPLQPAATAGRVLVFDRPGVVQSALSGGMRLPLTGRDDLVLLMRANDVLGGSFLSRLNLDLREEKGWTYGVSSGISQPTGQTSFRISTTVETDRTAEALMAMRDDMAAFLGRSPITSAEFERTIKGATYELPGLFATSNGVMGGLQMIETLGRPDDYYTRLAERYRTLSAPDLDRAARSVLNERQVNWVIVGDAAKVVPQLERLGIRYERAREEGAETPSTPAPIPASAPGARP